MSSTMAVARRFGIVGFLSLAAAAAAVACSSAETANVRPEPGAPDGERPPTGADGGTGGSSELEPVRFKIQLDYRFDRAGFFNPPERKKALEAACRIWGRLLSDSYPSVPKGTFAIMRDPEKPDQAALPIDVGYEIDDLLIFVGSSKLADDAAGRSAPTGGLSQITDDKLRAELDERYNGASFRPWTAWISFDNATPFYFDPEADAAIERPIPSNELDFVSVALHEIGHILGFGTAPAFTSKVQGGVFIGEKASALNGGSLQLTPEGTHVPKGKMSGGERMLMDPSDGAGQRSHLTPLDRAVFEDLGHTF